MSASAITLAAFMAIAARPECGADQGVPAVKLAATAQQESGFDPLAVNVNGAGGGTRRFATAAEAIGFSSSSIAQGKSIDLGLMQINNANLARHHLTIETAFDACQNLRAGAEHLADDLRAASWELARRRYNCGGFECGAAYARGVVIAERVISGSLSDHPGQPVVPPARPEPSVVASASPFVQHERARELVFRTTTTTTSSSKEH
jgi:type IV secretion system protein VirB1